MHKLLIVKFTSFLLLFPIILACNAREPVQQNKTHADPPIITGAEQMGIYLPLLQNKRIAIVANQTSKVGQVHLVDTLRSRKVDIIRVFAPEHGFRGEAGPGDEINSGIDSLTGLKLISLYGNHKKPLKEDLQGIDIVVFDIQDVGARFYTYISTLYYVMEACAENNVQLILLDRPNPNGFYVDGPVLDTAYRSFVGIVPIPIVHGLTIGEFAMMVNGEGWLTNHIKCDLKVIKNRNYNHSRLYDLPVRPSPNLPNMASIYLYPSLCLFEGTKVSVGRGTDLPFQLIGFPGYTEGNKKFKPVEKPGVIKDPPYEDKECNGIDLSSEWQSIVKEKKLNIQWLIKMYKAYSPKDSFFISFFEKLSGDSDLRKQIIAGKTEAEIRASWEPKLAVYREMRKRYLLYSEN